MKPARESANWGAYMAATTLAVLLAYAIAEWSLL